MLADARAPALLPWAPVALVLVDSRPPAEVLWLVLCVLCKPRARAHAPLRTSRYCEGLHGELARMAGVSKCAALQAAKSVKDCTAVVDDPAVAYARKFAEEAGRGPALKEAYDAVVQKHGSGGAQSVQALCWFLNWGSLGGNTLNSTISQIKESGKCGSFELLFSAYYAPLFGVIALMNAALKRMPKMPDLFFQGIGVTLTIAGGSWLTPVALLALARKAVRGGRA